MNMRSKQFFIILQSKPFKIQNIQIGGCVCLNCNSRYISKHYENIILVRENINTHFINIMHKSYFFRIHDNIIIEEKNIVCFTVISYSLNYKKIYILDSDLV